MKFCFSKCISKSKSSACKIVKSGWQYILQYYIQLEIRLPELKSLNIIRRHVNIAINISTGIPGAYLFMIYVRRRK